MTVTQEMKPLDMNDGDYAIWLATPGNASIGGNDVAAICGLNPWAKPADTYDRIMRMDTRRVNSAMQRGIMLEPIVAHLYEEQTGRMLRRADHRFKVTESGVNLRANIDREIFAPGNRRPLEIKAQGAAAYSKLETEGIPVYYWLQGQHYAYVWGSSSWAFASLSAERWELWTKDVKFDASQYMEALTKVEEFWHEYVVPRVRPGKLKASAFSPPSTGDATIVQREDPDWVAAVSHLKYARKEADDAAALKKEAEQDVKDLMGDDETVVGGGARVTWKPSRRRKLDEYRLRAAHPEVELDDFFDVTETRTFRPTFDE
jgi:predicted phage-related endonuclease